MSDLAPIELVTYAADKLGDLVSDVVFLGGAVVGLLVSDTAIRAPSFLGTKMDAFNDPKRQDHHDIFMSRDFGDVIRVIDGRPSIADEVLSAPAELKEFLEAQFARILTEDYVEEAIAEQVETGRIDLVVERIKSFVISMVV